MGWRPLQGCDVDTANRTLAEIVLLGALRANAVVSAWRKCVCRRIAQANDTRNLHHVGLQGDIHKACKTQSAPSRCESLKKK